MSASAAAGSVFEAGFRFGPYDIRHLDVEEVAENVMSALAHFGCVAQTPQVKFEHARAQQQMTVVLRMAPSEALRAKQIVDGVLRA